MDDISRTLKPWVTFAGCVLVVVVLYLGAGRARADRPRHPSHVRAHSSCHVASTMDRPHPKLRSDLAIVKQISSS